MMLDNTALTIDRDRDPGLLTWVDDATAADPTAFWTLGRDATQNDHFRLVNHDTTDTVAFEVRPDDTTVVTDFRATGKVTHPLHLAGTHTRVSGFDTTDRHWLHAGNGASSDQILAFDRRASGDYALYMSEGDTTARVLTTSETLDADTLDGHDNTAFVHADGSVGLTDRLDVGQHGFDGAGDAGIDFTAAGTANRLTTDGTGGGWTVFNTATSAALAAFAEDGSFAVPNGPITQQGNPVLTTASDTGVSVQNTDGTDVVATADAITAGADLAFSDDGDDTATLSFTGSVSPTSAAVGDTVTQSGDGSTTTFTLAHSLGTVPDGASVTPESRAASTDCWITDLTASAVELTYDTAPPAGTDNLTWRVQTTASGLDAITISDDDATVVTNPQDINMGDGVAATADGDNTVTLTTDPTVATLDAAETVTGAWTFDTTLGVAPDTDHAFANASGTTQFAFAYDSANDRHEWVDRANATPIAYVDRAGGLDIQQTLTVAGTSVATTESDVASLASASAASGAVPSADGSGGVTWQRRTGHGSTTTDGDGSTTTFTIPHGLGATPSAATVTPTSRAAMADFYVSNTTASDVVITYASAPPTGTGNLGWHTTVHA